MGKYIPENIEKEILSINWFSQLGEPITKHNVFIEKNLSKVNELISSIEWENITLEESNNMRGYLYNKISLKEQKEWNFIAEEGRYFINQKIIPVIPEIEGINKDSLIHDISWNLLHFIIEEHYKKKKIIKTHFFRELFELYSLGHLPCGWSNYPNGKIIAL